MNPLTIALYVWVGGCMTMAAVLVGLAVRDELDRRRVRRDDLEACWLLPAREPTRTQKW